MTFTEYKRYYQDLTSYVLGGNQGYFDVATRSDMEQKNCYNYANGLVLLALISLIDANFFSRSELKTLRKFQKIENIRPPIHQIHLSCFIYIRDCFAHNPNALLLPDGENTNAFLSALSTGTFGFASVSDGRIEIKDEAIHRLHLIIRRLYGRDV